MTRPDVEVMRELLAQVKAAEGPDRLLDYELAILHGWTQCSDKAEPVYHGQINLWWAEPGEDWSTTSVPPYYTASISEAVEFAEHKLPGTMWAVGEMEGGPFCRLVYPKSDGFREVVSMEQEGGPCSAPLAILAATLTALIAAEDRHG